MCHSLLRTFSGGSRSFWLLICLRASDLENTLLSAFLLKVNMSTAWGNLGFWILNLNDNLPERRVDFTIVFSNFNLVLLGREVFQLNCLVSLWSFWYRDVRYLELCLTWMYSLYYFWNFELWYVAAASLKSNQTIASFSTDWNAIVAEQVITFLPSQELIVIDSVDTVGLYPLQDRLNYIFWLKETGIWVLSLVNDNPADLWLLEYLRWSTPI
jgi:hypothetical protein